MIAKRIREPRPHRPRDVRAKPEQHRKPRRAEQKCARRSFHRIGARDGREILRAEIRRVSFHGLRREIAGEGSEPFVADLRLKLEDIHQPRTELRVAFFEHARDMLRLPPPPCDDQRRDEKSRNECDESNREGDTPGRREMQDDIHRDRHHRKPADPRPAPERHARPAFPLEPPPRPAELARDFAQGRGAWHRRRMEDRAHGTGGSQSKRVCFLCKDSKC